MRLVKQPAVQHDVHRAVRRFDLHRAEQLFPLAADFGQHRVQIRSAILGNQPRCLFGPSASPSRIRISVSAPGSSATSFCIAPHGSSPAPTVPLKGRGAGEAGGIGETAIAADELAAVARPARLLAAKVEICHAVGEGRIPWVAREHRSQEAGSIFVETKGAEPARDVPSTHST